MFFVLILTVCFVPTHQTASPNCLRDYPDVLDAEFSLYNKMTDFNLVTKEDVAKHTELFSTRFKHAHNLLHVPKDWVQIIGDGLSLHKTHTKKEFGLFLGFSNSGSRSDVNEGIRVYEEIYDMIKNINSGNKGPVLGLYVGTVLDTYPKELEAVEYVFGLKENSTYPIGMHSLDCLKGFENKFRRIFMQRQDFINCKVDAVKKSSPEASADEVIYFCERLNQIAISVNVSANITCSVAYPSFGTSQSGINFSVSNFQKFWCRIVNKVMQNQNSFRIIMRSAFDVILADYKNNGTDLYEAKYHEGWWRRRNIISYEASAFVEKVEELNGGNEHINCNKECGFCSSSKECGLQKLCYTDTSFQPFENGPPPKVCLSVTSFCAPRPPNGTMKPTTCESTEAPKATVSPTLSIASGSRGYNMFPSNITIFIVLNCTLYLLQSSGV